MTSKMRVTRFLLLAAKLSRQIKLHKQEKLILQWCHSKDKEKFWKCFQSVYRFTTSLPETFGILDLERQYFNIESLNSYKSIYFFPDYSNANQYQSELYRSSIEVGCSLNGLNKFDELIKLSDQQEVGLLHIHWLNAIFDKVAESDLVVRSEAFLQTIQILKTQGWKIYWTVHNKYSHSNILKGVEKNLRNKLSELVDKVLLHHPSAGPFLDDWLSYSAHIEILEHGPYPIRLLSDQARQNVQTRLGIENKDLVLGVFGKIKPYKALDKVLLHLLPLIKTSKHLKLIIAGQQMCDKSKKVIALFPKQVTIIDDSFITDEALAEYYSATDFVVLSYEDILTSGSLFQSFSFARPVIAPKLGTIPQYVLDDFNGFLYDEVERLGDIFNRVERLDVGDLKRLSSNALKVASTLRWP